MCAFGTVLIPSVKLTPTQKKRKKWKKEIILVLLYTGITVKIKSQISIYTLDTPPPCSTSYYQDILFHVNKTIKKIV